MKIKPGDKVRFLNDVGGGIVKYFTGKEMAMVETDEGFEMPVKISELVPATDFYSDALDAIESQDSEPLSSVKDEEETEDIPVSVNPEQEAESSGKIFLGVVPSNPFAVSVSDFQLFMINDSDWNLLYTVAAVENKKLTLVKASQLERATKQYIGTFSQSRISQAVLQISFLPYSKKPYKAVSPVVFELDLRKTAFYKQKSFHENDFFETPAVLYTLFGEQESMFTEKDLVDVHPKKEDRKPDPVHNEEKATTMPDTEEVDLHIESIVESTEDMDPAEILRIQMDRFTTALEGAILAHQKRIIFIHGIGNGRLKYELRKVLDEKYNHLKYQDASFQEYGFGATLVFLK